VIKAELKRCISIERRWNRNEVSRGSPDKEVNRRPTLLKKFTADALRGPRVVIIIIINGGTPIDSILHGQTERLRNSAIVCLLVCRC